MHQYISARILCLAFFGLLFLKISLAAYTMMNGVWSFGEGNDADYYHNYALGNTHDLANFWSLLLRLLHDYGLYSRDVVKVFLVVVGFVVIPLMVAELSAGNRADEPKMYWAVAILVSVYPTLCYYALDIYRDVILCFLFVSSVFFVKYLFVSKNDSARLCVLVIVVLLSYLMYLFRPYLGVSFIGALLGAYIIHKVRWSIWLFVAMYPIMLNGLYALGGLDKVLAYRSMFESTLKGGSNLGVVFESVPMFMPAFFENFAIQILGFYFSNNLGLLFFFAESVPFIFGLVYFIANRRFADGLVNFLVLFFIFYGAIWLVGNDNMGTAVRLRLCNYLALFICVVVVKSNKKNYFLRGRL